MGFHVCEYCKEGQENMFSNTSSGDVTLRFASGNEYTVPDMILHYVADHDYRPPQEFIDDVMNSAVVAGERLQTKSISTPRRVGYLSGEFEKFDGDVFEVLTNFVVRLAKAIGKATEGGDRAQYRGK